MQPLTARGVPPDHWVDQDWLNRRMPEPLINAHIPIIDAHLHLWDRPTGRYLLDEFLADAASGHRVLGSVYAECRSMYRSDGDSTYASIGEVEFANGVAAMSASNYYGDIRVCAGIVGRADLTLGSKTAILLDKLHAAAPERLKGVRQLVAWDPSPVVRVMRNPPSQGVMASREFRDGYAMLANHGLAFDAGIYHGQLPELIELVDLYPDIPVVIDHLGGWVGIGPYASDPAGAFQRWRADIRDIAQRPNVFIKLGGFGMRTGGIPFLDEHEPPLSERVAAFWKPHVDVCIAAFGVDRCMFESNFPVDKPCFTYRTMWNSFFRMVDGASEDELGDLFGRTANRFFNLGMDKWLTV